MGAPTDDNCEEEFTMMIPPIREWGANTCGERVERMKRAKTVFRVAGTILVALGILFLPHAPVDNPKRQMSAFALLADLGTFTQAAWILIAVGVVALVLSFFMTDRES